MRHGFAAGRARRFVCSRHMMNSLMMLTIMAAVMVGERDSFDRAA